MAADATFAAMQHDWRLIGVKKKAAPRSGLDSLRRGCLKGPFFVPFRGLCCKCERLAVRLQDMQLSNVVTCGDGNPLEG